MPFCLGTAEGRTCKGWEDRGSWEPIPRVGTLAMAVLLPTQHRGLSQSAAMAPAPLRSSEPVQQAEHHNG